VRQVPKGVGFSPLSAPKEHKKVTNTRGFNLNRNKLNCAISKDFKTHGFTTILLAFFNFFLRFRHNVPFEDPAKASVFQRLNH
jgi:hypothetical protein